MIRPEAALVRVVQVEYDDGTWLVERLACGHSTVLHSAATQTSGRRCCGACASAEYSRQRLAAL